MSTRPKLSLLESLVLPGLLQQEPKRPQVAPLLHVAHILCMGILTSSALGNWECSPKPYASLLLAVNVITKQTQAPVFWVFQSKLPT